MTRFDDARDVTVIVTCYNQQEWIEQCLGSLLAQDPPPREVIVVDDLSTDESAEVIAQWIARHGAPFRFVRHSVNRGLCATLNESLAAVDTEYVMHVCGDDWMLPGRVGLQVDALDASDRAVGFASSDFVEVDGGGVQLAWHDVARRVGGMTGAAGRRALVTGLLTDKILPGPAMIMRTSAVRGVGGWDESLYFEDYDLWLRLAQQWDFVHVPGGVAAYRVVAGSMSHSASSRPWLLEAEATIIERLRGADPEWDALIEARLDEIGGELAAGPRKK